MTSKSIKKENKEREKQGEKMERKEQKKKRGGEEEKLNEQDTVGFPIFVNPFIKKLDSNEKYF